MSRPLAATVGSLTGLALAVAAVTATRAGAEAPPPQAAPPVVTITDLGTLDRTDSVAVDVNSYGEIVGNAVDPTTGDSRPVAWTAEGPRALAPAGRALQTNDRHQVIGARDNGTAAVFWDVPAGTETALRPDALFSAAVDLNDRGEVLIWYAEAGEDGVPVHRVAVWHDGHETPVLPAASADREPPPGATLRPVALNNRGEVAITVEDADGEPAGAYAWFDGRLTDIGSLGGGGTAAMAIDEHGWIAGTSRTADGEERAVLWRDGTLHDLGTLGGPTSRVVRRHGTMSDAGHVIGTSVDAAGNERAFLWYDGTLHDLGTLGGHDIEPVAVNDRGQVVGHSLAGDGRQRAFFWHDDTLHDLGTLGGNVSRAHALNESGQVVGAGLTTDGPHHATLWTVR